VYTTGIPEPTTPLGGRDGAKGLDKALDSQLYGVPPQGGIFHKSKNITDHLPSRALRADTGGVSAAPRRQAQEGRRQAILAAASHLYATAVEVERRARAAAFRDPWEARAPQAVAHFFADFDKTLRSLEVDFPRALVSGIRPPNLLERFHQEGRRKQRDIGMFHSERGCEALWYLRATRETAKQRAALVFRC
jgi:transposase-like protein